MAGWQDLTLLANDFLRRPHDESGFGMSSVVQILRRKPGAETRSWCICKAANPGSQAKPLYPVRIHTWLSHSDYPDVDSIENETGLAPDAPEFQEIFRGRVPTSPTIRVEEVALSCTAIDELLSQMLAFPLPVVAQSSPPNDICSYEVIIGNLLSGVTYRWWGNGPEEWHSLTQAVMGCLALIEPLSPAG